MLGLSLMYGRCGTKCEFGTNFVSEPLCKTLSKFMVVNFHSWQVASEFVPGSRIVGAFSRFLT